MDADVNYIELKVHEVEECSLTPLIGASNFGHVPAVSLLIESGADVNKPEPRGGLVALHMAAQSGKVPVMELLISKGARIDARNILGQAPLHQAAGSGQKEAAICLLNHGADINVTIDGGSTPLHLAAQEGHFLVVKLLVKKGCNMHQVTHSGITPLHLASLRGKNEIVDYLVKKGASFDDQGNALPVGTARVMTCKCCGATDVPLKECSGCGVVQYCSLECQKKDWREGGEDGHKIQCPRIKVQRDLYMETKKKEAKEEIEGIGG